jgi:hypothetical protein
VSDRPVFGAVAPALLRAGVGSIIAFSQSVHVEAARLASERLYQQLIQDRSIGAALEEARSRLHARRERWLTTAPEDSTPRLASQRAQSACRPPERAIITDFFQARPGALSPVRRASLGTVALLFPPVRRRTR